MLQRKLRGPVSALINPLCRALVKVGVKANHLTVLGTLGVSISSLYFFARGQFWIGTLVVAAFALLDLLDGSVARIADQRPSKWGALLDSTLDRISDALIIIGIFMYFEGKSDLGVSLSIAVLVASGLVPYIRARAEGLGIECSVGIGERTERLIFLLVGTGLYGLGLDGALMTSLWLVLVMSVVTIVQRLAVVFRA